MCRKGSGWAGASPRWVIRGRSASRRQAQQGANLPGAAPVQAVPPGVFWRCRYGVCRPGCVGDNIKVVHKNSPGATVHAQLAQHHARGRVKRVAGLPLVRHLAPCGMKWAAPLSIPPEALGGAAVNGVRKRPRWRNLLEHCKERGARRDSATSQAVRARSHGARGWFVMRFFRRLSRAPVSRWLSSVAGAGVPRPLDLCACLGCALVTGAFFSSLLALPALTSTAKCRC